MQFIVKKCRLFEGVSPSFGMLDELLLGAKNAHRVNKTDLLPTVMIELIDY